MQWWIFLPGRSGCFIGTSGRSFPGVRAVFALMQGCFRDLGCFWGQTTGVRYLASQLRNSIKKPGEPEQTTSAMPSQEPALRQCQRHARRPYTRKARQGCRVIVFLKLRPFFLVRLWAFYASPHWSVRWTMIKLIPKALLLKEFIPSLIFTPSRGSTGK